MQRFTVSRDDRYHEAWSSACIAGNGTLVCSYPVIRLQDDDSLLLGCDWNKTNRLKGVSEPW